MRSVTLWMTLSTTLLLLGGCSGVEGVWDPKTGQTDTCSTAFDWSPWSQRDACIADHVAQGWKVKMRQ
jgi:uncharacterized protein YceK